MKKGIRLVITAFAALLSQAPLAAQSNYPSNDPHNPFFDYKKARLEAQAAGISASDVNGYVKFLEADYNSKRAAHQHGTQGANNPTAGRPIPPPTPQNQYCPNAGFENYDFSNWTGGYGTVSTGPSGAPYPNYNQTAPTIMNGGGNNTGLTDPTNYHTIMTTPPTNSVYPNCAGYDSLACRVVGTQTVSEIPVVNPNFGGGSSVRMNGALSNYRASKLNYNMALNPNNKRFSISYALVLDNGGSHDAWDQPYFSVKVTDQNGNFVPGCSQYTITINSQIITTDPLWKQSAIGFSVYYRPWQTFNFDFSNYPGITSVNVEFYVGGCAQGGHFGYAYVDAECGAGGVVSSFCAGSNSAVLSAPAGYTTYQWIGPAGNVPVGQGGTASSATITPVTAGQVYTCNVTSQGGCSSSFQTTVSITSVSVTNITSSPSCGQGASGTAMVFPTGSSVGYNYVWTNSSGSVVGNTQTATGLAPGVYTVNVSSPGCGAATATVAVGIAPPLFSAQQAPFCGTVAWINASAGSNYRWYAGSTPVPGPAGTAPTLTVTSPVAGAIYNVTYNNAQGCRDSVKFTLTQIPGGSIYVTNIRSICPGNTNAYAVVNLSTAASPVYNYTVTGPGGYSSILANTSAIKDSVTNLSIGTYSASVFDGQCLYNTTFSVTPLVYSFTVTPQTSTICVGNSLPLNVGFCNSSTNTCGLSTNTVMSCGVPSEKLVTGSGAAYENYSTGQPSVYANYYKNQRCQVLYLASELQAAGVGAGRLTSIAFLINSINSGYIGQLPGLTIKIKCTSATVLNSVDNTGLSQVFSGNYSPIVGWNTHTFSTPYEWNGTSNILVDICYTLNTGSSWTSNPLMQSTDVGTARYIYYQSDVTTACGNTSWSSTENSRPNARFGNLAGPNPVNFTYSWTPPLGLSSTTTSITTASPSVTTTYSLTVSPIGQTNCDQTGTALVNVTIPVTPTLTPVNPVCNTATAFSLTALPAGGTYSLTVPTTTAGVFTPSLATIGSNTVTYTFGGIGCAISATTAVNVEKFVPSTITGVVNPLCNTNPAVNLIALAQYTTGTWSGPGVSGPSFDPAVAGPGNHVLTYSTTSAPTASLCPSTSTLAVSVSSIQQPTATPAGPYCDSYSAQTMTVNPAGGLWSGTGIDVGGTFTPAQGALGANNLVYTLTNGPCTATTSVTVDVEKFIAASLTGGTGPFCIYDAATDLQLLAVNPGGVWSGAGLTGSLFTPAVAGAGTYTMNYHTASAPTASLCPDDSYLQIVVNPKPEVNALSDKLQGCEPLTVGFHTSSANTGTGYWDFGNNTDGTGLATAMTYTNPGTYQATFYYTDPNGCLDTTLLASTITVWDVPDAQFEANPNVTTIVASEVIFTNYTSNLSNNTYQWTFTSTAGSTAVSPTYMFPETGIFPVQMIATSPEGCKDTAMVTVTVNPDVVMYVANAFTPGNSDGLNDILYVNLPPTGVDYTTFHWQIFDRWGSMLFQTNDIYKGWNGSRNNSGDLVPQGIYVWKITFQDSNRKFYERTGHVTLLK